MTTPAAALDAWKKIARFVEPMAALVPWLEKVGSIEQAAMEAQSRCDVARDAEADAVAKLESTRSALAKAEDQLAAFRKQQQAEANAAAAMALAKAASAASDARMMVSDAKAQAEGIVQEAQRQAKAIGNEAKATMGGVKADIDKATAEREERRAEVRKLTDERDALVRDIAGLKAKHGLT